MPDAEKAHGLAWPPCEYLTDEHPTWPLYTAVGQSVMTFDADTVVARNDLYARANCRFWAEQGFGSLSGPYPTLTQAGADYK